MPSFLFWNLHRNVAPSRVARLAHTNDVDVVMLVESAAPAHDTLLALNRGVSALYHFMPSIGCERVEVYSRFAADRWRPVREASRYTIRQLCLSGSIDVLLAVCHLPSKSHARDESQGYAVEPLITDIMAAEATVGHDRTVLIGDLNMNPFEAPMVAAGRIHGVMSRAVAKRATRMVQGREYAFFYNPMWGLFGDSRPGPPGTFYDWRAEHVCYFWNMFDQFLLRPSVVDLFPNLDVQILSEDGSASLLSPEGIPDTLGGSDHLPVYLRLEHEIAGG